MAILDRQLNKYECFKKCSSRAPPRKKHDRKHKITSGNIYSRPFTIVKYKSCIFILSNCVVFIRHLAVICPTAGNILFQADCLHKPPLHQIVEKNRISGDGICIASTSTHPRVDMFYPGGGVLLALIFIIVIIIPVVIVRARAFNCISIWAYSCLPLAVPSF